MLIKGKIGIIVMNKDYFSNFKFNVVVNFLSFQLVYEYFIFEI